MLEGLFQWMEAQAVYGASPYIGPVVNLIHLLSMVLFMGALLMVDLRLLGLGLRRQPLPDVARDAQPWLIAGLVGIVLTGIPQTMERATDQYETSMFWVKMYLLLFGLVWMVTVRRRAVRQQESSGAWPKVVGLVSILAFMGVAADMGAGLEHLDAGRERVVGRVVGIDLVDHVAGRRQRLPERVAVLRPERDRDAFGVVTHLVLPSVVNTVR